MKNTTLPKLRTKLSQAGFTLIELLVVIGILAVLLAIVLIAINPARQFSQANDTQRRSDVNAILNAVHQFAIDNGGTPPTAITTTAGEIASYDIDICADVVDTYIAALPVDPAVNATGGAQAGVTIDATACSGAYNTGYTIVQSSANNRITVTAPNTEIPTEDIAATR